MSLGCFQGIIAFFSKCSQSSIQPSGSRIYIYIRIAWIVPLRDSYSEVWDRDPESAFLTSTQGGSGVGIPLLRNMALKLETKNTHLT